MTLLAIVLYTVAVYSIGFWRGLTAHLPPPPVEK
jgi:hypothetical protein